MKLKLKLILPLLMLKIFATSVCAQDLNVYATLNAKEVAMGSSAKLTITVEGTQDFDVFVLPEIDGLQTRYIGPSTSFSFYNGKTSSTKALNYSIIPEREGDFEIPAMRLNIKGQTYETEAISFKVVDSLSNVPVTAGSNQTVDLNERIFMSLQVSKSEMYLNEGVPVKVLLFVNDVSVEYSHPSLDGVGYTVGEFQQARQFQQVIKGVRYNIVEFNTVIYPTREGKLTLGPAQLQANILINSRRDRSSFGSMFDDDFFDSFFNLVQRRSVTITSAESEVNVKPLPKDNQPKNFSGAVGQFQFEANVSPTTLKEGDPITVKMEVSGQGDFSVIRLPEFKETNDFRVYDPEIRVENGKKTLEQVIIPQSSQVDEVPAIEFSYFDPSTGDYKIQQAGPFAIKVEESEAGVSFPTARTALPIISSQPERFGEDIVFIKENVGRMREGTPFYKSKAYYGIFLLLVFIWGFGYSQYMHTHRMRTDERYAKRLKAPKIARKGLLEAKKLFNANDTAGFYTQVYKVLQQYLHYKFHLSASIVSFHQVQKALIEQKIQDEVLRSIEAIFADCDEVRFASVKKNSAQLSESFERLERFIDYCERHVS